jgi:hypothetical protein
MVLKNYEKDPAKWKEGLLSYVAFWTASDVSYREIADNRLRPMTTHNDPALTFPSYYGSGWAPQENRDTSFRELEDHQGPITPRSSSRQTSVLGRRWTVGR